MRISVHLLWWSVLQSLVRGEHACLSRLYCFGAFLDTIQQAQLFMDPKRFVDMPAKHPTKKILNDFKLLGEKPSSRALEAFVKTNFHRAGHELKIIAPPDLKPDPAFLDGVHDEGLRVFARTIHSKWKTLLRRVDKSRICQECESTTLDLPYPFIVPGGRFREFYYWDTNWILEGLYVSEMCLTAKSVVENMVWLVERYGFVPNGSRVYYLNRSQPPVLPIIIKRYLEECGGKLKDESKFLKRVVPILETEHQFWMTKRVVELKGPGNEVFLLNHYGANMSEPRPESYMHDIRLAANFSSFPEKQALYHNIAATTESGWDFSGRWMNWTTINGTNRDFPDLGTTMTSQLVPVDLNAVLLNNEMILSNLWEKLANTTKANQYRHIANQREKAIELFLYTPEESCWKDYNYVTLMRHTDRPFYITDLCPLWYAPFINVKHERIKDMLERYRHMLYDFPGGIPISLVHTTQQWDFPNVWAPTQFQLVKLHQRLFKETGDKYYDTLGLEIAQKWVNTTYCGYQNYGYIFEKYDANLVGQPGGGGEYIVQEGFGWSNGILLWIMKVYGERLRMPEKCPKITLLAESKSDVFDDMNHDDYFRAIFLPIVILWSIATILFVLYQIYKWHTSIATHFPVQTNIT